MNDIIEPLVLLGVRRKDRIEVRILRGIARVEPQVPLAPELLASQPRPPLVLLPRDALKSAPGPVVDERLSDMPSVRAIIGDAKDEPGLSLKKCSHEYSLAKSERSGEGRIRPDFGGGTGFRSGRRGNNRAPRFLPR
jgi:hypothetical protein